MSKEAKHYTIFVFLSGMSLASFAMAVVTGQSVLAFICGFSFGFLAGQARRVYGELSKQ